MPVSRIPADEFIGSRGRRRGHSADGIAGALLACTVLFGCLPAGAATVTGMYEATVSLPDRSERAQAEAVQSAMKQVLMRVTGRRDAGDDPALAPLVNDARRYVQQFRVIGGNQFFAGFDGAKVERAIVDAGQPLWGHERPATLVVIVDESGRRIVQAGDSESPLRTAFARGATQRGLPVMWPDASRPIDLASMDGEHAQSVARDYNADAVLVGRALRGGQAQWVLYHGSEPTEWSGSLEEGAHGTADAFAREFSSAASTGNAEVAITVSGIGDVRDYATVTTYLESLTLISDLAVDELAGDTVVYRARVQGGADRLTRAIALGQRLVPVNDASAVDGGSLRFRLRQ